MEWMQNVPPEAEQRSAPSATPPEFSTGTGEKGYRAMLGVHTVVALPEA